MSVNVEPIPPNDRTGLIAWLRRLAMSVAALARKVDDLEKRIRNQG
ncbi:MAG: hypothetical protein IJS15_17150 [Victivallales bacterium]|nr:hypothetical protein [Victivallales bacterium]